MRILVISAFLIGLSGCFGELGKQVSEQYNMSEPAVWSIKNGTEVDVGGDFVEIIGTDQCNNGFGDTYPCWKFSLIPGDTQLVTLSNGVQEIWTTQDAGEKRIHLVRPNGFKIVLK